MESGFNLLYAVRDALLFELKPHLLAVRAPGSIVPADWGLRFVGLRAQGLEVRVGADTQAKEPGGGKPLSTKEMPKCASPV